MAGERADTIRLDNRGKRKRFAVPQMLFIGTAPQDLVDPGEGYRTLAELATIHNGSSPGHSQVTAQNIDKAMG
jgi:hypothetical protein